MRSDQKIEVAYKQVISGIVTFAHGQFSFFLFFFDKMSKIDLHFYILRMDLGQIWNILIEHLLLILIFFL